MFVLIKAFYLQYLSGHSKNLLVFEQLDEAMVQLGISDKHRMRIYECLAAILHLGNVDFHETEGKCKISNQSMEHISYAAGLLKVDQSMLEMVLLKRAIQINGCEQIR